MRTTRGSVAVASFRSACGTSSVPPSAKRDIRPVKSLDGSILSSSMWLEASTDTGYGSGVSRQRSLASWRTKDTRITLRVCSA